MTSIQRTKHQLHFARTNNVLFVEVLTNKVTVNIVDLILILVILSYSFFFLTDFE